MTPTAPVCITDFLWWGFLGVLSILGYLISLFLRRGVIDRLDNLGTGQEALGERLSLFVENCHKCQAEMTKQFVSRSDYERLLAVRQEVHGVINGRIGELEIGQRDISNKLSTFHNDLSQKIVRLSKTFVFRDAVISMRLDSLSDKIGVDKWTRAQEEKLANDLKEKLELVDE